MKEKNKKWKMRVLSLGLAMACLCGGALAAGDEDDPLISLSYLTKTVIPEILEQVDLAGYGKRKPNTLSGGQKQRIAIARALVKSPEIIMADEPTGALDSETGKQVFDTLKKLSKDKLVIVVSHDRDFAESYGDRHRPFRRSYPHCP